VVVQWVAQAGSTGWSHGVRCAHYLVPFAPNAPLMEVGTQLQNRLAVCDDWLHGAAYSAELGLCWCKVAVKRGRV
jgi:hypothetical protein